MPSSDFLRDGVTDLKAFLLPAQHTLHFYRALRSKLDRLKWSEPFLHARNIARHRLHLYHRLSQRIRRAKLRNISERSIFRD